MRMKYCWTGVDVEAFTPILVYNQGIEEDTRKVLVAVSTTLCHTYGLRPASYRSGKFKCGAVTVKIFDSLFDSGALHHSFISADIVKKEWLKPAKRSSGSCLSLVMGGQEHTSTVAAIVWRKRRLEFILELPDKVKNYTTQFFLMLKQQQELSASVEIDTHMHMRKSRQ